MRGVAAVWFLRRPCPDCGQGNALALVACPDCGAIAAVCSETGTPAFFGAPDFVMRVEASGACARCGAGPIESFPAANAAQLRAGGLNLHDYE